uniref:Uncharacterized protein n=1 Tax=Trieres chinensis TaxID=1514140 RepID=A0A7S2A9X7_TRICV|mmetsp:Transcript_9168/g.19451  ORF Transcript_9168/g.19451 Transcript_9168/m.19451 type:complete len:113 (+) Transcript_9168:78-416(+)
MGSRKRISADGTLISEGEESAAPPGGLLSLRSGQNVDAFGFNLEPRQFVVVLVLAALMLGGTGLLAFVFSLGAYSLFRRVASSEDGRGGGEHRSAGANIRGVKDLPKPPPRG